LGYLNDEFSDFIGPFYFCVFRKVITKYFFITFTLTSSML